MKTILKILVLTAIITYFFFAFTRLARPAESVLCTQLHITIGDSLPSSSYLQESYISNLLKRKKIDPVGQEFSKIDLHQIEEYLEKDPYILSATCYHTATGTLRVSATPMKPILHVMTTDNEEYYLDASGEMLPVGIFNFNLCIATGNISKEFAKSQLRQLGNYLTEDSLWNEQIEQIHVISPKDIILTPKTGNCGIELGEIYKLKEKFHKLTIFYENGFPKVGWNKYKTINLAYDNQIVCTKHK